MPLQHLFTKREQRIISGDRKERLIEKAANFWKMKGYRIDFRGPFLFHAENFESHLGLRKVVDLSVSDYNEAAAVDLTLSATLGDTETAVGALGIIVLPLAAVVVGGISYLDYDQAANREITEFWQMILSAPGASAHMSSTPSPSRCPNCGALLDVDSIFCKVCGTKVR
jgi:hypothetical protein